MLLLKLFRYTVENAALYTQVCPSKDAVSEATIQTIFH